MHVDKENETRKLRHIEPLVLSTQLPSESEDSDGEPGINDDCNIKANTISKKLAFLFKRKKI